MATAFLVTATFPVTAAARRASVALARKVKRGIAAATARSWARGVRVAAAGRVVRGVWVVGLALAVGACGQAAPEVEPEAIATASVRDGGPVRAPREGALFGAWVRPDSYSQPGRIASINGFEEMLGRPLDIVNTYRRVHEEIGTESDLAFLKQGKTLMISWAGGSSADILAGEIDPVIRRHAKQIRELRQPVLVRIRWEMDRPNLAASVGSPESYQDSWHHVRRIFTEEKASNVSWVFCPTAEGFTENRAGAYYPGDEHVDWTCVDVYAGSDLVPMATLLDPFLRWASQRPKPMMIGEYGVARAWPSAGRASWLANSAEVFKLNPQIKAVLYFESDPEDRTEHGEFSVSEDLAAFEALKRMARDPYFTRH
jgi:hypothetical protein